MLSILLSFMLTSFISVDGNLVETTASEAMAYEETVVTDIGNPDNLNATETTEIETTEIETTETQTTETTTTQTIYIEDNAEEVALLSEAVELLAENSSSVTGTVNTSVLDLMDRMVDSYPDYYTYAGFRTSQDDSYTTTLYIAKRADTDGNTIIFSEDCIAVDFARYQQSGYSSYIYYNVYDSPNATVDISSRSIVYTNVLDGYPSLGTKSQFPTEYIWISLLLVGVVILFTRKHS